jgi:hypothetical protein
MDNTEDFKSFVKSLKDSDISRFPDIDLTGNIPNSLGFNSLMLFFLMIKISAIPFVEDFTKIGSEIGLTPEEAISFQEINNDLILCQRIIMQKCMEQHVILCLLKFMIDDLILSLPEIEDSETIDIFQEYLENFYDLEKVGGGPKRAKTENNSGLTGFLRKLIFLFLIMVMATSSESARDICPYGQEYVPGKGRGTVGQCVAKGSIARTVSSAPTVFSASTVSSASTNFAKQLARSDPTQAHDSHVGGPGAIVYKDPQSGIILYDTRTASFGTSEFATSVASLPRMKSKQYDFHDAVTRWQPEKKQEIDQIFNNILKLIGLEGQNEPETGRDYIVKIIDDYNKKAAEVAKNAETSCLVVMEGIKREGGFSGVYDLNNVTETLEQINQAEKLFKEAEEDRWQESVETGAKRVVVGVVAGAGAGAAYGSTGGPIGAGIGGLVGGLVGLGTSTWNHFMGSKHALRKYNNFITEFSKSQNPITQYDPKTRNTILEQVYGFSRVYCSYAFSSQIKLTESNSIEVYGTKLGQEDVHGLFTLLKENLSLKIVTETNSSNTDRNIILDSLHQRLEILQTLNLKISDYSSIRAPRQLEDLLDSGPNSKTLTQINTYFTEQLGVLKKLALQSEESKPLEKERQIQATEILLESLEIAKIKGQGTDAEIKISQQELYYRQLRDELSYNQTKIVVEGWSKWLLAPVGGILEGAGEVTGDALYGILSGILGKFPTWVLVGGGIVATSLALSTLSGPIVMGAQIIGKGLGWVMWAIKLTFEGAWWICKMALTPVGWVYRSLGIFVGRNPAAAAAAAGVPGAPPANHALPPGFGPRDPQPYGRSGGRKTKKIRKQKRRISKKRVLKNRTKKRFLNAKRRRTKYRK